jgi:hypothetical protein
MTPAAQAGQFITGVLLGCGVGIFYGFLRPVQRKLPHLTDLFFSIVVIWVYLFHSFAICKGDLRLVYLAAGVVGALGWDKLFGRWLQPVFDGFWHMIGFFLRPFWKIFKKIGDFAKKILATAKKWGKIKWRKNLPPTWKKGAEYEQTEMDLFRPVPPDLQAQFSPDQMRGAGGHYSVRRGTDHPADIYSLPAGRTKKAAGTGRSAGVRKLSAHKADRPNRLRGKRQKYRQNTTGSGRPQ